MIRMFAFLRAINVGGHTVKMNELRQLFHSLDVLGFQSVETSIPSGNIIFEAPTAQNGALENLIETGLQNTLGCQVATFIRTEAELADISTCPAFPRASLDTATALNVAFLKQPLEKAGKEKHLTLKTDIDDFHVHERTVYWLCRTKKKRSALF